MNIRIVNAGSVAVTNMECDMESGGRRWVHVVDMIDPGEKIDIRSFDSDLYIWSLEYNYENRRIIWDESALATPTEIFELHINEQGDISGAYKW